MLCGSILVCKNVVGHDPECRRRQGRSCERVPPGPCSLWRPMQHLLAQCDFCGGTHKHWWAASISQLAPIRDII